ncbi:MAG: sulfurtransferase [Flavobacteriaceae bacterium]
MLIGSEKFKTLAESKNAIILDASRPKPGQQEFELKEFIPNARPFNYSKEFASPGSSLPNTAPNPSYFQEQAQKLGINDDSTILIYDCHGLFSAPRAWYMFKVMGHKQVYVLNGGLPAWKKMGYPTSTKLISNWTLGNFISKPLKKGFVGIHDVLENKNRIVVDARGKNRFSGKTKEPREGIRSGHIPGAINLPYTELLTEQGTFKSKNELLELFDKIPDQVYFSCGSGVTACILALAAEHIGREHTEVYDGSWTEYGASSYPVSTE